MDAIREKISKNLDWVLVLAVLPILGAGLLSMSSFVSENYFANRQIVWVVVSFAVFLIASRIDWRFLRNTGVVVTLYLLSLATIAATLLFPATRGISAWISLGPFTFQPSDFLKIILVVILAKYFSRRHIEIAHFKHIVVSGVYAVVPFGILLLQPDLGSAVIVFLIWLGMILFAGVSRKHLLIIFAVGVLASVLMWSFVFEDYQKDRITTFVKPLSDIQGAGYNAFQSTIAVGSGQIIGKGVGLGTQSRLEFLPEYETDFIFAAFAEEWGFIGVLILFGLFGVVVWRILKVSKRGATNFELLFGAGIAIYIMSHFVVNIGMNIGLLPVTGITLPFMSYGGSHLLAEFLALGILMGMRKYSRAVHHEDSQHEFLGAG